VDIRQLRYFIEIVDLKSISKAAARLYVAQPALSQHVAALESELGVQLLVRSTKGVQTTGAGVILYRHARSILRQMDDARRDVQSEALEISGVVALGLPTSTAAMLGMPLLRLIHERYPRIHLQLFESVSGYLEELLGSGRLDFSVLPLAAGEREIVVEPILEEELFFVGGVNGRFEHLTSIPWALLADVPLVLPSQSQELRHLIDRRFRDEGIEVNVIADIDSLPTLLATAAEGFAGTILSYAALALLPRPISLPYRSLFPKLVRPVSVCRLRSTPITAAAAVIYEALLQLTTDAVASRHWLGAQMIGTPRRSD
jgi:LysR family nitrogen assimilation transcriptional regulator